MAVRPLKRTVALVGALLLALLAVVGVGHSARADTAADARSSDPSSLAAAATAPRPWLIEHGWDVSDSASVARNAAKIDALPFDGITVTTDSEPISRTPVSLAAAQSDLANMPTLKNVKHNFLIFRLLDDSPDGLPYNLYNDTIWSTIASNVGNYAKAAAATGKFDGIVIDPEYYGSATTYPWDYGTSTTPWTYSATEGATPGRQPAQAQEKAQTRGKQTMDAIRANWPTVKLMSFRGAEVSEPATFTDNHMKGYDVAWANELLGPWFVGFVQSAYGSAVTLIDGGESYWQRSLTDFQNAYSWMKTGLPNYGGRIVPSGPVTAAKYQATLQADVGVFDKDISKPDPVTGYVPFTPQQLQTLLTYGLKTADKYEWLYSENFDWRGTGWPLTPAPAPYINAVKRAKAAY